jgi:hypothetical protein
MCPERTPQDTTLVADSHLGFCGVLDSADARQTAAALILTAKVLPQ